MTSFCFGIPMDNTKYFRFGKQSSIRQHSVRIFLACFCKVQSCYTFAYYIIFCSHLTSLLQVQLPAVSSRRSLRGKGLNQTHSLWSIYHFQLSTFSIRTIASNLYSKRVHLRTYTTHCWVFLLSTSSYYSSKYSLLKYPSLISHSMRSHRASYIGNSLLIT